MRIIKKSKLAALLSLLLIFTGCSANSSQSKTIVSETSTAVSSETTAATSAETEVNADLVLPLTENNSGKVMIQTVSASDTYKFNSYIITSVDGEAVVADPTVMPAVKIVDINPAAIVNTHGHGDHVDQIYQDSYDCQKICHVVDDINTKDFHIYTFPSSHNGDVVNESTGNVIIVFEVNGLRIAHMGDCGQTFLTDEQLEKLGDIDIAFMQFENNYSSMNIKNEKGFKLMEQLNPKIVIPTHYPVSAVDVFEEKYGEITVCENLLQISKEDFASLPKERCNFYIISNTHKYY